MNRIICRRTQRYGAVVVWTAISVTTLTGIAALAVDVGYLHVVKTQLQSAADAAALAGASALLDPRQLTGGATWNDLAARASLLAQQYAGRNKADGQLLQLSPGDITVGHITNGNNLQEPISLLQPYNAIRIFLRRDSGAAAGPVRLYLAPVLGSSSADLAAAATAYLDGHVAGYRVDSRKTVRPLIPVSVRRDKWVNEILHAGGSDTYGYSAEALQITLGADGIPELSIFPEKQNTTNTSDGAGDFGLLNIGNKSQGTPPVGQQIQTGLSEHDVVGQFGGPEIRFAADDGSPLRYNIEGTPGAKNALAQLDSYFQMRVGTVIGFFIHNSVTDGGATSIYDVTGIQFGRIMMVDAQGSVNGAKAIIIQPVAYLGDEIITNEQAVIHDTAGRVRLIR